MALLGKNGMFLTVKGLTLLIFKHSIMWLYRVCLLFCIILLSALFVCRESCVEFLKLKIKTYFPLQQTSYKFANKMENDIMLTYLSCWNMKAVGQWYVYFLIFIIHNVVYILFFALLLSFEVHKDYFLILIKLNKNTILDPTNTLQF